MNELLLMIHPTFGILGLLSSIWVFVEGINIRINNIARVKYASYCVTIFTFLTYLFAGYWYVNYYETDKALIKAGPWPFAHSLFMETKEHLFFTLLLLAIYLPIVAVDTDLFKNKSKQILLLTCSGLIALLSLGMEGMGAIISMGVKITFLGS